MLTAVRINTAKPKDRAYKLTDALGLFLYVTPTGGKLWRFKYRFDGKEKLLAFGKYPDVSLADAREKRDQARKKIAQGTDPSDERRAEKLQEKHSENDEFEVVAREWHEKFKSSWTPDYASTLLARLQNDVFPWIGQSPIDSIIPAPRKDKPNPDLLTVLRRIESRGAVEMAHRVNTICSQVFRYAVATGRAERDITVDLRGALPPADVKHHAAITEPKEVAGLLRAIDGYTGSFIVRCALRLAPLVYVRPGELRYGEWTELDWKTALWTIPADKMKMDRDHIVPLSRQAFEILKELYPVTGSGKYMFPSARTSLRPMSENAVRGALRNMGYTNEDMTGHGFRAMARTILDEVLQFRPEIIEHQLAHTVKDPNGRAYNRTAHLDARKEMMQVWADYLDGLRSGKVVSMKRKA